MQFSARYDDIIWQFITHFHRRFYPHRLPCIHDDSVLFFIRPCSQIHHFSFTMWKSHHHFFLHRVFHTIIFSQCFRVYFWVKFYIHILFSWWRWRSRGKKKIKTNYVNWFRAVQFSWLNTSLWSCKLVAIFRIAFRERGSKRAHFDQ